MASYLGLSDLTPFAVIAEDKANLMIEDATALAVLAAPCLAGDTLTEIQIGAVRAILRGAVLRWNEAGSGVTVQQSAGPFAQSITPEPRRNMFWPSEISQLQGICAAADSKGAYSYDTIPAVNLSYPLYDPLCGFDQIPT